MKKVKVNESNSSETNTSATSINRRDFLKISAAVSSSLMLGSAGLGTVQGCGHISDWKSVSFPKVLLHNFALFDGISNRLQKNLVLLIENGTIKGIERKGDLSQYQNYKVVDLKHISNGGALRGKFALMVDEIKILDFTYFNKDGKRWVNVPQKEFTDKDTGEKKYYPIVWIEKEKFQTFIDWCVRKVSPEFDQPKDNKTKEDSPF